MNLEEAVLGAIILKNSILDSLLNQGLKPEGFSEKSHQILFEIFITLRDRDECIDLVTIVAELRARGDLEAIGGTIYLVSLFESMGHT